MDQVIVSVAGQVEVPELKCPTAYQLCSMKTIRVSRAVRCIIRRFHHCQLEMGKSQKDDQLAAAFPATHKKAVDNTQTDLPSLPKLV